MSFGGVSKTNTMPKRKPAINPRLRRFLILLLIIVGGFVTGAMAQTAARDIDYAILLSISEEVTVAERYGATAAERYAGAAAARRAEQSADAADAPDVPEFSAERPGEETPELSRAVQRATAHRLRGETVAAAEAYAEVLRLSREPIHAFFYAEVARANGDDLLADHLGTIYREARAAGERLPARPAGATADVRVAGVISDAATGVMLAGVEVLVLDPISHRVTVASTDANGLFTVDGVSRGATVRIVTARAGYTPAGDELYVDPAHTRHAPIIGTRVYLQPVDAM